MNIQSFLSHLHFTCKVISLSKTWFQDPKHAASFILSNCEMVNLHRQNGRAGGSVCIFIHESIDIKEEKDLSISKNDIEILSIEILTKQETSFLVQSIGHILSSFYRSPNSSLKEFKNS